MVEQTAQCQEEEKRLMHSPLGQQITYKDIYDSSLLFPILRSQSRATLNMTDISLFYGVDVWNAYELSWVDQKGKPVVACARIVIPYDSEYLIESKSLKLYLNTLNHSSFSSYQVVENLISTDLGLVLNCVVKVTLFTPENFAKVCCIQQPSGKCLDYQDVEISTYHSDASLLKCRLDLDKGSPQTECLYSNLLRSTCPVTGQPDWGTIVIEYQGATIDHQSLLAYICSFRKHEGFHEQCVERIFIDILNQCSPDWLTIYACYLRRGGLDINPWRSNCENQTPDIPRLVRQ